MEMEAILLIKALIALVIVVILIFITSKIVKHLFKYGNYNIDNHKKELNIKEVLYIDPSNKIVNISRGKRNYILMLGKNNERLIEAYNNED